MQSKGPKFPFDVNQNPFDNPFFNTLKENAHILNWSMFPSKEK